MLILIGAAGLLILAIRMGKRAQQATASTYIILALLALLQVCVSLFVAFTMQAPVI